MFLFVFQFTSRREANRELTRPTFWELFQEVFPEVDSIPHTDTVNRFLEEIEPDELEQVLLETIKQLLRCGRLTALLVEKQYVIAIDGTQKLTRGWQWAQETIHRRHGEEDVMVHALYRHQGCWSSPRETGSTWRWVANRGFRCSRIVNWTN